MNRISNLLKGLSFSLNNRHTPYKSNYAIKMPIDFFLKKSYFNTINLVDPREIVSVINCFFSRHSTIDFNDTVFFCISFDV